VPGLTVARSADGKGWEATPAAPAVTSDALQHFVDGWQSARALWVQAETGTVEGEPVTVTLADHPVTLRIETRDPQFVIDRPDLKLRYVFRRPDADKLMKLPEPKTESKTTDKPAGDAAAAPASAAPKPPAP